MCDRRKNKKRNKKKNLPKHTEMCEFPANTKTQLQCYEIAGLTIRFKIKNKIEFNLMNKATRCVALRSDYDRAKLRDFVICLFP